MSSRIKGNDVAKENQRLYDKIHSIASRKPQMTMPHAYTKEMRNQKFFEDSMMKKDNIIM